MSNMSCISLLKAENGSGSAPWQSLKGEEHVDIGPPLTAWTPTR